MASHPRLTLPAMPITNYATYDEIRAVLGVSDEELEDATLALPMYEKLLNMELLDISEDLPTLYASITANPAATAQEKKLLDVVSVFSAFAISKHLLTSLPLFAPKRITDGRAETDRVTDPFEDVRQGVNSMYSTLKTRIQKLLELLGTATATAATRIYATVAGLAVNPITNI